MLTSLNFIRFTIVMDTTMVSGYHRSVSTNVDYKSVNVSDDRSLHTLVEHGCDSGPTRKNGDGSNHSTHCCGSWRSENDINRLRCMFSGRRVRIPPRSAGHQ